MSRVVWECNPKLGGKFHLKLNISESPIAYKYRKGKMQRTLKRESKELEIVKRETIEVSYSIIFWEIQLVKGDISLGGIEGKI